MPVLEFDSPRVLDLPADERLREAVASLVREAVQERGRLRLRLQGDSMWPTILPGDLVEVRRVSTIGVKLGDIVIWERSGELIAHRVVGKVRENWDLLLITKGDNSARADQRLSPRAVLARVTGVVRPDGPGLRRVGSWRRLEVVFWLLRWRIRSFLGRLGRVLPWRLRWALRWLRDRLGHCLSWGFKAGFLR